MTQEELNKALALLKKDNRFKRLSFFSSHAHQTIAVTHLSAYYFTQGSLLLSHKTVHLGSVWGCSHTKRPLTLESLSLFIRFQLRQLLNNFTRAFLTNILVVIVVPTAFIWINLFISESQVCYKLPNFHKFATAQVAMNCFCYFSHSYFPYLSYKLIVTFPRIRPIAWHSNLSRLTGSIESWRCSQRYHSLNVFSR